MGPGLAHPRGTTHTAQGLALQEPQGPGMSYSQESTESQPGVLKLTCLLIPEEDTHKPPNPSQEPYAPKHQKEHF